MFKVGDKVLIKKYIRAYQGLVLDVTIDALNNADYLVRFDDGVEDYFREDELHLDNKD